ncbi:MAG: cell division protein ZapA [Alphaproteobacteria bacterium]|nr:cell division protein ZapA [Alphaproteobacteria bacterium]
MSELDLNIHGKNYRIACGDGEEDRVRRIAVEFDQRVNNLLKNMGKYADKLSEAHLLVMVALLMTDEIDDLRSQTEKLQAELAATSSQSHAEPRAQGNTQFEERVSHALAEVASRLEMLAARLDQG